MITTTFINRAIKLILATATQPQLSSNASRSIRAHFLPVANPGYGSSIDSPFLLPETPTKMLIDLSRAKEDAIARPSNISINGSDRELYEDAVDDLYQGLKTLIELEIH